MARPLRCLGLAPGALWRASLARWVRDRLCSSGSRATFEDPDPYLMKLADPNHQQLVDLSGAVRISLDEAESLAKSG